MRVGVQGSSILDAEVEDVPESEDMNDRAPVSGSSSSSERDSSCLRLSSIGSLRGILDEAPPTAVRKGLGMGETLIFMLGSERACCHGEGNLGDSPVYRCSPNIPMQSIWQSSARIRRF